MANEQTEAVVEQGAKPEASPTPATAEKESITGGGAKPVSESPIPFHQSPEVQAYLEKQLRKREAQWEKKWQERDSEYTRRLELLTQRESPQRTLSEEEQAVEILKQKLGLDSALKRLEELDKRSSSLTQAQTDSLASFEFEATVKELSGKYGMNPTEAEEQLRDFIDSHPLGGRDYRKGAISAMGKLFAAEHAEEFAERAANLKLIKEQREKKQAGTESSSKGDKAKVTVSDKSIDDYLKRRAHEEGGISFD